MGHGGKKVAEAPCFGDGCIVGFELDKDEGSLQCLLNGEIVACHYGIPRELPVFPICSGFGCVVKLITAVCETQLLSTLRSEIADRSISFGSLFYAMDETEEVDGEVVDSNQ